MKKKVILIICLVLVLAIGLFVLTGCGNKKEENKVTNNNSQTTQKNESTSNTVVNNTNNTTTSNNKKYEYTYKDGTLTQIVDEEGNAKQTDFVIDGVILVGNRHSYEGVDPDSEGLMNKLVAKGYKKEGINSSFYQNEHIEMYLDTKYNGSTSNVKVLITPHKTVEELEKMSISELTTLAEEKGAVLDYQTPDEENSKYIGDPYVNADYPEGKYDILFTYKGKLAYFINVNFAFFH